MPDKPKTVQAAAVPADINILPNKRVGTIMRDHYANHITDMHAMGHLDADEYEARRDYVLNKAQTMEELRAVTADLPAAPRAPQNKIVPKVKHPVLDFTGNPIVTAAALAFGIPAAIFAASHLMFIIALVVMVVFGGLFLRWLGRGE